MASATRVKSTRKFKALVAAGFTPEQAEAALTTQAPADPQAEKVALLVAAGFDPDQAAKLVSASNGSAPAAVAPPTHREQAEALVTERGFRYGRGRVYVTGAILEAAARVLKGGHPEVVATSGIGSKAAVVVYRESSGDVSIQNLLAGE